MTRPVIYVLAGVNGAGKSSLGSRTLTEVGLDWFNPDTFARLLQRELGCNQEQANAAAWHEGMDRLDAALARRTDYAFETTLGGNTVPAKLRKAATTHDVLMWFCGLDAPEHHLARVRLRVAQGGHDIPEAKIRERYASSIANLIGLMPHLSQLQVYDNSIDAVPGAPIPDPRLLLQTEAGRVAWPTNPKTLRNTPDWAKPVLEAALQMAAAR